MKSALFLSTALILGASAVRAEDALIAAQNDYYAAWDTAPLAIQYSTQITEKAAGYGLYTMRADNVYKVGENILTYVEPVGFGYKTNDDATTTFGFTIDLNITAADGAVVFTQDKWSESKWSARLPLHEVYLSLNLGFGSSPFPAGDYVLTYTLHDDNSVSGATGPSA